MIYPLGSGPLRKSSGNVENVRLDLHGGSAGNEAQQPLSLLALITRPPPLKGFSVALRPEKCAIYVSIDSVSELSISFVHLF